MNLHTYLHKDDSAPFCHVVVRMNNEMKAQQLVKGLWQQPDKLRLSQSRPYKTCVR